MEISSESCEVERTSLEALSVGGPLSSRHFTVDSGVNSDHDWKDQISTMLQSGLKLSQDFNAFKLQQQQDELDFSKSHSDLKKRRDQAVKQHQAHLEKLESVRVKLQLNNSKATRKTFLSKIHEMTSEKSRSQEERDRVGEELSEVEVRLAALEQEQEVERHQWEQDLTELKRQTKRAQKDAMDAEAKAMRDLRSALEKQRDMGDEMVQAWLNQVSLYLAGLRGELPHKYHQEKPQWERRETAVKRSQMEHQARISELLIQVDKHELESLPPISLPALPQVPMAELYFHRVMQMTPRPSAPPPGHAPHPAILNPRPSLPPPRNMHFPIRNPQFPRQPYYPPMGHTPSRFPVTSAPFHTVPPQTHDPPPRQQAPAACALSPADNASSAAHPPSVPSTAPPAGAAGQLDKVLEMLGVHFPNSSRAQLTWLLQQVKTERGTLAGLSMEEVVEQSRLKMETSNANPRPNGTEAASSTQPALPPTPHKPCLVCQMVVNPSDRFELKCSHTVHTDCIQVWLKSSKSNTCPFCPNK